MRPRGRQGLRLLPAAPILLLLLVSAAPAKRIRSFTAHQAVLAADADEAARAPAQELGLQQRLYHMGFLDDYRCTGRVYDEPRRFRLKCAHNPKRIMPCRCKSASSSSPLIHCDCGHSVSNAIKGTVVPAEALEDAGKINAAELPEPHLGNS